MKPSSSSLSCFRLCFCLRTLLISLSALAFSNSAQSKIKLPENETVPALIAFGDSVLDTGNNNNLNTSVKVNFPPYGKDLVGAMPTGRFCDGKVPTDLIAEELGIKELVPAYLDPNLSPTDLPTGVCFASGGTGYDPLTPKVSSVLSLPDQLNYFKDYIGKLKALVGEDRTNFILAKSLFLLAVGSNDIAGTYFNYRRYQYNVQVYTDSLVNLASDFLNELYGLGARRISVFSTPPIGCAPALRSRLACRENYNKAAQLYNQKLSAKLDSLTRSRSLPNSRTVFIDIYSPLLDQIQNPKKYGFEVVYQGCCGTGAQCDRLTTTTCPNASTYEFWDRYHQTEEAYKLLVSHIVENYIYKLF